VSPAARRRFVTYADGASRGNPGPASFGAVVLDADSGEVLAEVAETVGTATNNVAEYRGLLAGLRAAAAIDPEASVEARMDSKLVVEQMSGRWKVKHPAMRPLAAEAATVLPAGRVRYTWVPRERNTHADRLANEALDAARAGRTWAPEASGAVSASPSPGARADGSGRLVGWGPEVGTPTTLLLLRHGETPLTVEKRFSGSGADPGLTEQGHRQAAAAAEAISARGDVDAVIASPLRRTTETADVVAGELGLPVAVDDGFREAEFGEWDGSTFAEVQERWPEELAAWLGATSVAPPGGESFDAVARRVRQARDRVLAAHPGRTVLVVTHVTPVKTLVRLALAAPPESIYRMELAAASLTVVQWYPDGHPSLRTFNDTSYLAAVAAG